MRNRAKCKLCHSIIESFHRYDYVSCKCGEIAISGGNEKLECYTNDKQFTNFLRVDDEGNELIVKYKEKNDNEEYLNFTERTKPSKKELKEMLNEIAKVYESLPENAKDQSVSVAEFSSFLALMSSIVEELCKE